MSLSASANQAFAVSRLCDLPSFAPMLAAAHAREWQHLYADWNQDSALKDFSMEKKDSDLPTTWVIHNHSEALMGSISLVMDDLPGHPDLNPWLASLYVFPKFRGRGLGRILVQRALDAVQQHQIPNIYLFTENQVPFFSKFGFTMHGPAQANGQAVTIMKWKV